MKLTAKQLNRFLFFKLPSAFWCGVRVGSIDDKICTATVRYKWMNKNPFQSIYFAVLAMTSELSTGAMLLKKTKETGYRFSSLVLGNTAGFTKKAVGKITFTCVDGTVIDRAIKTALETKEGVVFTLTSSGVDEVGDTVATFEFKWSIKLKATS